jgi:hypothetical protein
VNDTLQELFLAYNQAESYGCHRICDTLVKNSSLTTLKLKSNRIGVTVCEHIYGTLLKNSSLTTLDLSQNQLEPPGCKYIIDLLKVGTVAYLDLYMCGFDEDNYAHLGEVLKTNRSLNALHLSVGPGMSHIEEGVKVNPTITGIPYSSGCIKYIGRNINNRRQKTVTLRRLLTGHSCLLQPFV